MSQKPFTCGLDAVLTLIGSKWKPLILYFVAHETRRYGELKRCLPGISHKMLSQQLKEMQSDGIIHRVDYQEIPPRVDYSVTEFGLSLARSLRPLCAWGDEQTDIIAELVERRATAAKSGATSSDGGTLSAIERGI